MIVLLFVNSDTDDESSAVVLYKCMCSDSVVYAVWLGMR